ncbi:class I SAM-dependent methyltransferase [Helicobacter sp. MIT 21-1697]|uniref:class I SAM-dependent methyltransferase n=1 Tax=Helicobacter sp. MIT 21-1697 TaxID=2993733 RepID=UPI00224A4A44|nr:class I SAM-dependent methyltransferase [Helicobacter sp. MIT 21-1697]MCX2716488.1 class I SAM-dependent methyltransferase [Helicobacter sp. MIT 21-1697]
MNEKALEFFGALSKEAREDSVKLANNTDFSELDAKFILKYANEKSHILDLGSGSGLIVNKIYPYVEKIVCVDFYQEFTKFIAKNEKITIINEDLFSFNTQEKFDIVSAFGVMHYVNEQEAQELYQKYQQFLKPQGGGLFIIKNQFGIKETINVSGYSQEQKREYYSQYRYIEREKQILKDLGFEIIEVCDIYPKEANRWENTHFWAIVGKLA